MSTFTNLPNYSNCQLLRTYADSSRKRPSKIYWQRSIVVLQDYAFVFFSQPQLKMPLSYKSRRVDNKNGELQFDNDNLPTWKLWLKYF